MAWQLDIHVIDVGQGDSTLIVATDPTIPLRRTMLIDGGEPQCAETIHNYYRWFFLGAPPPLNHLVLTHYNDDHAGGLRMIMQADDLDDILTALTAAALAADATAAGQGRPATIAAVTAAVYSRAWGNTPAQAQADATGALTVGANAGDNAAVDYGVREATPPAAPGAPNAMIAAPAPRKRVARAAAFGAADYAGLAAGLADAISQAMYNALIAGMPATARFRTAGLYTATNVIDLGDRADTPPAWPGIIGGRFTHQGSLMRAPHARTRTPLPALGREVLWNSGPGPVPAPAGAPAAYVVSRNSRVWQGIGVPPLQFHGTAADNDSCIGLLIRFNNYTYFTAGDLPIEGEDPVAQALTTHGLPDPAGNPYNPLAGITAFKCGHHGSDTATGDDFLDMILPTGAFISAGFNPAYGHPSAAVITSLTDATTLEYFFMTNCNFPYPEVPASQVPAQDQVVPVNNRSRVCGDNNPVNMAPGRNRGNIWLQVTEAESMQPTGVGHYDVSYYENTHAPAGFRIEQLTI